MTTMPCAQLREIAPELALGLLTGEERATAIEHLDTCQECRTEVASLADTADELLLLAPGVQPPPDFEGSVLARLDTDRRVASPPGQPSHRGRTSLAVAAAAVVLFAAVAALWLGAGRDGPDVDAAVTAEMRTGTGDPVGDAFLEGDPATVVVDVPGWVDLVRRYGASSDADYRLAVELDDGSRDLVTLPPGSDGRWRIPLAASASEVASVAVIDDQGRTWCSARFQ